MRTVTLSPPSYYPEFDKDGIRSAGHFLFARPRSPRQKPIKPKIPLSAGTDSISNAPTTSRNLAAAGGTNYRNGTLSGERTPPEEQSRVGRQRPCGSLSSVRPTESQNNQQHVDHSSQSVTLITVRHHSYFFVSYPSS